jgi:penicillin G amidase
MPADSWLVWRPRGTASTASPLPATSAAASNNWVVSGTRTASGQARCSPTIRTSAAQPAEHLVSGAPHGRALDAIGATLPGSPGVVIGHNGRIAWGVTNLMADVQDLFVERLNAKRQQAEFDGAWEPLRVVITRSSA